MVSLDQSKDATQQNLLYFRVKTETMEFFKKFGFLASFSSADVVCLSQSKDDDVVCLDRSEDATQRPCLLPRLIMSTLLLS